MYDSRARADGPEVQVPTTTLLSLSSTISAITSTPAVCEANDCVCVCDKRERTHTQMQNDDDAWLVLCRRCGSNAQRRFKIKFPTVQDRLDQTGTPVPQHRQHMCVRVYRCAHSSIRRLAQLWDGSVWRPKAGSTVLHVHKQKATPAFARCCCAPGDGCLASLPTAVRPCRARAALRREGLQGVTRLSFLYYKGLPSNYKGLPCLPSNITRAVTERD